MNIVGIAIHHIIFGDGTCVFADKKYITVYFPSTGEKKFAYPTAFEKFLSVKDEQINNKIQEDIQLSRQEKQAESQQEIKEKANLYEQNISKQRKIAQIKNKITNRANKPNIAFKCNYCDGGKTETCIGFKGRCSADMQRYNIEEGKHSWCTNPNCVCMQEHEEKERTNDTSFVCYESRMLLDWEARAGVYRTGEKAGEPMRLANVTTNSLAILTTRLPNADESSRIIFAVFLIKFANEGDEIKEGRVVADEHYKIELTPDQAEKMKFWNYYKNSNSENALWGSGLHRYFDDETALHILKDVACLKKGTPEEVLANDFLSYYDGILS